MLLALFLCGLISMERSEMEWKRELTHKERTQANRTKEQKSQFKIKKRKERAFVSLHLPLFVSLV